MLRSTSLRREPNALEARAGARGDEEKVVELEIVGESYRQEALAGIAGPKDPERKQVFVDAVLRCEPTNEFDTNAVRVEARGQLLGYVAREQAARLSPAIQRKAGGSFEARGAIVGGWKDSNTEGHYGVRVWITARDAARLQFKHDASGESLRSRVNRTPGPEYPTDEPDKD